MESAVSKVAVLDKAVAILRAYRDGETLLQPRVVAERTGISLPTAYRLMRALAVHGLLEREGSDYRLGITLLRLGGRVAASMELRRVVMPHLSWLNAQTGENAELHVLRQEARVPVEVVLSSQNLRPFVQVGEPLPVHVGASGKVLLAWLPGPRAAELADASARRFGDPAFEPAALRTSLDRVRRQGWSGSDGERSPGVAAVSAPVRDASGRVVGAVVASGPSVRLTAKARRSLVPLVLRAATEASRGAGYVDERPVDRPDDSTVASGERPR
ncbi:MAG: IclR family transcriptional regulator [Streptosporangiaceae bacterium]